MKEFKYRIEDDRLEIPGLTIDCLNSGRELTWDELRFIFLAQTRFAAGRPIMPRTKKEFSAAVDAYLKDRVKRGAEADTEITILR